MSRSIKEEKTKTKKVDSAIVSYDYSRAFQDQPERNKKKPHNPVRRSRYFAFLNWPPLTDDSLLHVVVVYCTYRRWYCCCLAVSFPLVLRACIFLHTQAIARARKKWVMMRYTATMKDDVTREHKTWFYGHSSAHRHTR